MIIPGRDDFTEDLVHFVKGESDEAAFDVLRSILSQYRLLGGTGYIKGEYRCVCFTEAPLAKIGPTITQAARQGMRYRPFGILIQKTWLYEQGGRPVIYGPDDQFDQLPADFKWRHVRYEPGSDPPIDFSWEREWRIHADELEIVPGIATALVKDGTWARRLQAHHDREQNLHVEQLSLILDPILAEQERESFPWDLAVVQ